MARIALAAYDLPGEPALRPLAFGLNATFEVRAASMRYVLRVYRTGYRTADQIRSELQFLLTIGTELADDPAVPEPIPDREGALVVETNYGGERRYCDLLSWLDGPAHSAADGLDDAAVWALGRALGRLHNAGAAFRPSAGFALPRWDADGMFDPAASPFRPTLALEDILTPADRAQFAEIASRTQTTFDVLGRGEDVYGITHIDYILGNCFLSRRAGGWNVSVFDFDDCGWGRNANHCLLTARPDVSETPADDAVWRMDVARRCLELPV
ncbi:MAG: phosphotransferase [Catenulispora sp.]|nr:phosphotransferase [Catenulispora sp.]